METTKQQQHRAIVAAQAEVDAARERLAIAGAKLLALVAATDEENEQAQDLLEGQKHDNDAEGVYGADYEALIAENVLQQREDEAPARTEAQS